MISYHQRTALTGLMKHSNRSIAFISLWMWSKAHQCYKEGKRAVPRHTTGTKSKLVYLYYFSLYFHTFTHTHSQKAPLILPCVWSWLCAPWSTGVASPPNESLKLLLGVSVGVSDHVGLPAIPAPSLPSSFLVRLSFALRFWNQTCTTRMSSPVSCASCSLVWRVGLGLAR